MKLKREKAIFAKKNEKKTHHAGLWEAPNLFNGSTPGYNKSHVSLFMLLSTMQNLIASESLSLSVWGKVYRTGVIIISWGLENQNCCSSNIWPEEVSNPKQVESQFKRRTASPQVFVFFALWFGKGQ